MSPDSPQKTYKVVLDSGFGDLPTEVIEIISTGQCCFSQTKFGGYIFSNKWQVCVEPINPANTPCFVTGPIKNEIICPGTDFSVLNFHDNRENDVGTIDIAGHLFKVVPTAKGLLRVRCIVDV